MATFITGASGLVGSHLLLELLQSYTSDLRILIRHIDSIKQIKKTVSHYIPDAEERLKTCTWILGDVLDEQSLRKGINGAQYIYHCAAIVSFDAKDKELMLNVNVQGTANIVKLALEYQIKKLCYVSSIATIGNSKHGELITEEYEWTPGDKVSSYSISKHEAEQEVWKGIKQGLKAVMVNPCMIVGPGNWGHSSTLFFPLINRGMLFYPTGGTSFVDVRDVVEIMLKLMHSSIQGERFIVASENLPFRTFFSWIADALGKRKPWIPITPIIGKISWMMAGVLNLILTKKLPITKESVDRGGVTNYFDNTKIKRALSYEFRSVKEAITHTAKCYRKELSS